MPIGSNAMMYALAAVAAIAFALGYGLADKVSAEKIAVLEHAIIEANLSADAVLQAHIAQKKQNELEAELFHKELEASRAQNITIANDRWDRLHKSQHTTGNKNTVPNCESTGVSDETPGPDLLAGCTELLERADKNIRTWVDSAVAEFKNNCGLKNQQD